MRSLARRGERLTPSDRQSVARGSAALVLLAAALTGGCDDDKPSCARDEPDANMHMDPVGAPDASPDPEPPVPDAGDVPDASLDAGTPELDGSLPDAGSVEEDGGFPLAPPLRNLVAMQDLPLAKKALAIMGSAAVGAEGSCRTCHALGRPTLTKWRWSTDTLNDYCFQNTSLSDVESVDAMLECIRTVEDDWEQPISEVSASQLGIYSAAAHLPWFEFAFEHKTSTGEDWHKEHDKFVGGAGMPRSGKRLTQEEFDVVAEWFARGLPKMRDLVPLDSGNAVCTPTIHADLKKHVADMQTQGWRAHHRQNALVMFGCEGSEAPLECLTELPPAADQAFGATWDVLPRSRLRVLHDNSQALSSFWSRTSADGRYISSALVSFDVGEPGAQILDLLRKVTIPVHAGVDPGYFPDNSGFVFQGSGELGGALVCDQSVLAQNPTEVLGTEPQCGTFGNELIGIYEQLAKTVGGSDYWVASGIFESDDGGPTNPYAPFDGESSVVLTPMINEGSKFVAGTPTTIATPDEGDPVLSPSGKLLLTRAKGNEAEVDDEGTTVAMQNGYRIHRITTKQDSKGLTAELDAVGTVCLEGGKPMLSFDERWMVIHHYVTDADAKDLGFTGADDPGFLPYKELGATNLVLVDLLSGKATRITNMGPGQFALFPHFRADNWIYFVVRAQSDDETGETREYFVASDAALLLEQAAN